MQSDTTNKLRLYLDVHDTMDVVEHYYPVRWYEGRIIPSIIGVLVALTIAALQALLHIYFDWRLGLISVVVILVGEAVDIYSTTQVLRLRRRFLRRNLVFPVHEANPLLPKYPTLRDLVFGKPTLVTLMVLPIAAIFPALGVEIGISKLCTVFNNHRKKLRLQRVLDFARGKLKVRVRDFFPDHAHDQYVRLYVQ